MTSAFTAGGWLGGLYLAVVLIWLVSEVVTSWVLPRIRGRGPPETVRAGRGSGIAIVVGILAGIALTSEFARLGWATFPLSVVLVGIALILAGVAIRQWAIAVLGRFFSPVVRAMPGQPVVTRGPYRWVRHPSYTGALVTLVGLGLAGGSWEGLVSVLGISALVFGYRIHVEERFLLAELGTDYQRYCQRTKRLFPFIW